MMNDPPSEQELQKAREEFWREVARVLSDRVKQRGRIDEAIKRFREELKTHNLEHWAYHDGVASVADKIARQMKDESPGW